MIPGRIVLSLGLGLLAAGATLGSAGARQDVARQIDLTITQGTSMAAAASPDRRSIAIDLLGGIWILPFAGGEANESRPNCWKRASRPGRPTVDRSPSRATTMVRGIST